MECVQLAREASTIVGGGGTLERDDGRALQRLAQRGDGLGAVGAIPIAIVETQVAECVIRQAAHAEAQHRQIVTGPGTRVRKRCIRKWCGV